MRATYQISNSRNTRNCIARVETMGSPGSDLGMMSSWSCSLLVNTQV